MWTLLTLRWGISVLGSESLSLAGLKPSRGTQVGPACSPDACSCPGWRPSFKAAVLCSMLEGSSLGPAMSRQRCQAAFQTGRCLAAWAQVQADCPRCRDARRWMGSAVQVMAPGQWYTGLLY